MLIVSISEELYGFSILHEHLDMDTYMAGCSIVSMLFFKSLAFKVTVD